MIDNASIQPKVDPDRRIFHASYSPAENDIWRDNPLIEALPAMLTDDQFARAARFFPPHDTAMREHPKHLRLAYIERVLQFFVPMEKHLLLQQRFARIIRDGYVARNPLADLGWTRLHRQLDDLKDVLKYGVAPYEPPSTLGFAITGIGGVGKTVGVNSVLRTYPRMLLHRHYTDSRGRVHPLMRTQIIFLKLDCPEDGTLKSLCLGFFRAVDRLTGFTNYDRAYSFRGNRLRTATDMLPDMARVAALHSIGLLIIDEIQFLSKQKSGGREQMLQWFTHLVNEIKLPVVMVGTPRAEEVLNGAFWQMRRNAGQGEGVWHRMKQDGEWKRFLRALWRYQYVRNPVGLVGGKDVPSCLSDALYCESQGIVDFAVKMFMVAQERAINSGFERLTPGLIEAVAQDAFGTAREIIQGIKDNDPRIYAKVDDVKFDLERARGCSDSFCTEVATAGTPTSEDVSTTRKPRLNTDAAGLSPVLPDLVRTAVAGGGSGVQTLREKGYVRSPTEFVD